MKRKSASSPQNQIRALKGRIRTLESAIRKHRRQTGHDLCWENDEELWSVLPDSKAYDHTPPPWEEFIQRCAAYRKSRERDCR